MATNNLKEHETEIANAIRTVKGTTAKINPQDFAKEIQALGVGVVEEKYTIEDLQTVLLLDENELGAYDIYISRDAGSSDAFFDIFVNDTRVASLPIIRELSFSFARLHYSGEMLFVWNEEERNCKAIAIRDITGKITMRWTEGSSDTCSVHQRGLVVKTAQ